jgi:dihydrofolate reductase
LLAGAVATAAARRHLSAMATDSASKPRCSVYIATSVDGFIARADDGLDWLKSVERPGEDYGYADFMKSVDVLLMGRRTYDVVAGFDAWPYGSTRVVVATRRPGEAKQGASFASGTPADLVAQLEREGVKHVYVDGGVLIRDFMKAGLIDDLTLSIIPIVLGSGIPLWADGGCEHALRLESSRSFASGLVQNRYVVAKAFASAPG